MFTLTISIPHYMGGSNYGNQAKKEKKKKAFTWGRIKVKLYSNKTGAIKNPQKSIKKLLKLMSLARLQIMRSVYQNQ